MSYATSQGMHREGKRWIDSGGDVFVSDLNWAKIPIIIADRSTMNNSASGPGQMTVAGLGAIIPLVYGRARLTKPRLVAMVPGANGSNVVAVAWCQGPIDAIEQFWVNDATPDSNITFTHYLGTAGQGVDATLQAAFAAQGVTYTDTLPGTCYTVATISALQSGGFPKLAALVRGAKVYDPRGPTTAWSDNPTLAVADFATNAVYGMGKTIDWSSVTTCANANDAMVGTPAEKKRLLNLALEKPQECEKWLAVLCQYAGCWAVPEGNGIRLVPDAAGSSVKSFNAGNIVENSLKLKKRGLMNAPTVMTVTFTDSTQVPYRAQTVRAYNPDVLTGAAPWRESQVNMEGVNRYSQANREAIERLNALTLNDLTMSFGAFDDGIAVQKGDIIDVTHPIGLSAKLARVSAIVDNGFGRFTITASEFDPAQYSSIVVTNPTNPDTSLSNPLAIPIPTTLTVSEDVYYIGGGAYASRLLINWTNVSFSFLTGYKVEVWDAAAFKIIDSALPKTNTYTTPPIAVGRTYTINVSAINSYGTAGTSASASITVTGKNSPPGNVPSFSANTVGNLTQLQWTPAPDFDLTAHEIRYWATGIGAWATGTLLDRIATPATRYNTQIIPPGNWTLGIVGLDSVRNATYPNGQPSATPLTATITVNQDPNNLFMGAYSFTTPTLTNMSARSANGQTYWITDFGDTWNAKFTAAMSTYANPIASYHTSGTASLVTESYDYGQVLTGAFTASMSYVVLAGTPSFFLELSPDNTNWNQYLGGSANTSARYARIRMQTNGTDAVLVNSLGSVNLNALTYSETFNGLTSNASGPTTVTCARHYAKYKQVVISPVNVTEARSWVVNMIETSGGKGLGIGNVIRLDGSTGYVSIPDATQLHFNNGTNDLPFTIEMWAALDVAPTSGNYATMFCKSDQTLLVDNTTGEYFARISSGGICTLRTIDKTTGGSIGAYCSTIGLPLGQWLHWAFVYDGSGSNSGFKIYINGVPQAMTGANVNTYTRMRNAASPLKIGCTNSVAGSWWNGPMDEVRAWNVARTQAQIQASMQSAALGSETNLVACYHFDSSSGTSATDSTSNANTGTLTGTVNWRPYDGFDYYLFNASGTQVAQTNDASYTGV